MKQAIRPSFVIVLNSTAYYLLSYIIILILFQLITVATARFFDIPAIVWYNKIDFLVNTNSWNFDSVKMVFSSGPVISLILGLISLVIFLMAKAFGGLLKLLFFWSFVHGLNMFVGSIVLGAFMFEGMGYVFAWMYFRETLKMFFLFAGLFVLMGSGALLVKSMLLTSNTYYNTSRPETRNRFKRDQFLYPYLIGTILLVGLRIPVSLYELLLLITPGFLLIPLFSRMHNFTIFYFDDEERDIRIRIKMVILTIILIAIFRTFLQIGLRIG